jgi:hypothetical protein
MDEPRTSRPRTETDELVADVRGDDADRDPDAVLDGDADGSTALEGRDRGGTGEPVGADNIREGRVRGTMIPPSSTQGQGEGG